MLGEELSTIDFELSGDTEEDPSIVFPGPAPVVLYDGFLRCFFAFFCIVDIRDSVTVQRVRIKLGRKFQTCATQ